MLKLARRALAAGFAIARAEVFVLAALLVIAGSVLVFVELADEVHEGESLRFDRTILLALREPDDVSQPIGPKWLAKTMGDITSLGSTSVLTLLTIFTTGYLFAANRPIPAAMTPLSVIGAALAMHGLKRFFERTRPEVVPHLVEVTSASFPSGHAMVATAAYLTLGVIMAEASGRRVGIYVMTSAIAISLLIGFSRVFLGVHWPSDVIAGWCAGAAWALLCWLVTFRWIARSRRSPTEAPGV